jgi:hypothetical protein
VQGCTIDWKKGKNVTVKVVKKKQKHRSRGSVRTVTRTVQNDSFFNFFEPPTVDDVENEMDEHIQSLLTADFEIGHSAKISQRYRVLAFASASSPTPSSSSPVINKINF